MRFKILAKLGFIKKDQVTIRQHPKYVLAYPVILIGYVINLCGGFAPHPTLGLLYVASIVLTIAVLGVDIDGGKSILLMVIAGTFLLGGILLSDHGIPIHPRLNAYGTRLRTFDPRFALAVSDLLGVIYLAMLFWVRSETWIFDQTSIRRYQFGKGVMVLSRDQISITKEYNDILEVFLLLAGDVVIHRNDHEIFRVRNVPFLVFKRIIDDSGEGEDEATLHLVKPVPNPVVSNGPQQGSQPVRQ